MAALLLPAALLAFSPGSDPEAGTQSCDAIGVCSRGCPRGMHLVAPPERSAAYTLRTGTGESPSTDPTRYVPGALMELYVKVEQRTIRGKKDAGQTAGGVESAKYIGLLLYAVKTSRPDEAKVGSWEIPLQEPPRFWTPDDSPGCERRAVMHRYADPKQFVERLVFRAPPAGTGSITFRCLIKQGDTNMGAFYWPTSPTSPTPTLEPKAGWPNGDLVLLEETNPPSPSPAVWSYRGAQGETCTAVCSARGLTCDEASLASGLMESAASLHAAVRASFLCAPPYLQTCSDAAPRMSGLGDGLCWYRGDACDARAGSACDAVPSNAYDEGLRLCPCVATNRRRAAEDRARAGAASLEGGNASGGPLAREAREEAAPCDEPPTSPRTPHAHHGAGGDPARCPNQRAARSDPAARRGATDGVTPTTPHRLPPDGAPPALEQLPAAPVQLPPRARELRDDAQPAPEQLLPRTRVVLGGVGMLVIGFALVASRRRNDGRGRRGGAAVLISMFASSGSAHNWIRGVGSRANNQASTVSPCRARTQYAHPHIQVNANTTFTMDWATGHHSFTDFVFIHARDEHRLNGLTYKHVNTYVHQAWKHETSPGAAKALFDGPYWKRNHIGVPDKYAVDRKGECAPPATCEGTRYTFRLIPDDDPSFVKRHMGKGTADPTTGKRHGFTEYALRKDRRLAYTHPEFPFIMAVHRFRVSFHRPAAADTAHFRFPAGTPPGRYIIYYMWGGYRDCVDVDVLPDHKPVVQTQRGINGYKANRPETYTKTDHCQHAPRSYDAVLDNPEKVQPVRKTCFAIPPAGGRNSRGQTTEEALDECKARCASAAWLWRPKFKYNASNNWRDNRIGGWFMRGKCTALNLVPLTPPPDVTFPEDQNIPWGMGAHGECERSDFAAEPAGSSICYGLREMSSRGVEAPWDSAQRPALNLAPKAHTDPPSTLC